MVDIIRIIMTGLPVPVCLCVFQSCGYIDDLAFGLMLLHVYCLHLKSVYFA